MRRRALLCNAGVKAESHAQDAKLAPDSVQLPLCSTMEIGGQTLRTLTTVMQFDKATEVMMSELRLVGWKRFRS